MRCLFFWVLFLSCACGEAGVVFPAGRWVDLSHDFSKETIYWPTAEGFQLRTEFKGITDKGYFYAANFYSASEHGGTHIDAPIHFAKDRITVDAIPVEQLVGPAAVIDVSKQAGSDADYLVSKDDLTRWEAQHGALPEGAIVLLDTGYHRRWPDRKSYMGTAERGPDAVKKLHFPGLHPDAARWLVKNRRPAAIGIDTPSIDYGQSELFESHRILFEKNVPAFENVANVGELPATGAFVIALPMKIRGGSGGPVRIVAWIPES